MCERLRCRSAVVVATCGVMLICAGCGGSVQDPRGQRVAAAGSILLDEFPLDGGRVIFETDQGRGMVRATAAIQDGCFEFPRSSGPIVGGARVKVYPPEMEMEELESVRGGNADVLVNPYKVWIPPEYNTETTLVANVTKDPEQNQFEFKLTSE